MCVGDGGGANGLTHSDDGGGRRVLEEERGPFEFKCYKGRGGSIKIKPGGRRRRGQPLRGREPHRGGLLGVM